MGNARLWRDYLHHDVWPYCATGRTGINVRRLIRWSTSCVSLDILIALRPECDGHMSGYSWLEAIQQEYGECIVASHLPDAGSATQPIEGGYMANAWMRVRHPDYDTLRQIMDTIGRTVTVHAG